MVVVLFGVGDISGSFLAFVTETLSFTLATLTRSVVVFFGGKNACAIKNWPFFICNNDLIIAYKEGGFFKNRERWNI